MSTLDTFWDTIISTRLEGYTFWGLMNSATKDWRSCLTKAGGPPGWSAGVHGSGFLVLCRRATQRKQNILPCRGSMGVVIFKFGGS